ncbi:hypothetical protein OIU74_010432 [Salix koriyanagi]|uniref:Uncharacterized protein n=1 Tax=Salix koriyanagi TaxID=2511006 RepID=A0A9Q0YRM6_9ROSI|nr:hypothetical protein OIU74_010432 [Salix koriyanagi]
MYPTFSKSEIKKVAVETTARTCETENYVNVNIGNKYFLATMQSSNDLEVKKWHLYDKRTIVAGGGTEGPVKKLVEENEGSVITTRRVELREAAKKALISRKRFQQAQLGEADKGGVGNPRKITWWYDPLTCSSMHAGDMVKWETAEACLADDQMGSTML